MYRRWREKVIDFTLDALVVPLQFPLWQGWPTDAGPQERDLVTGEEIVFVYAELP